jgi:hypothetical protein
MSIIEKSQKKTKDYFTQETDKAIVLYNKTLDPKLKSRIYEKYIHYPFFKLTENIIHTFKFYEMEVDEIEHLQHEVIIFLLSKIHLFDPDLGFKAYSYFGTIAKRYLITYNKKNYKKKIEKIPYETLLDNNNYSYDLNNQQKNLSEFIDRYIKYIDNNLYKFFPKQEDAQIADAILEILKKREDLKIFNKKAIYIYIREIIDVKTPKITKIANKLYNIFKENYIFYINNDYSKF